MYTDFFMEYPFKLRENNKDDLNEIARKVRRQELSSSKSGIQTIIDVLIKEKKEITMI